MLRENIDKRIADATLMALHNPENKKEVEMLRLIKAEYLKYKVSKEALTKPMDDAVEMSLLKKMVKQRRESADLYVKGNRQDLADQENWEADYIEGFLPKPATEAEILGAIDDAIVTMKIEPIKKNMGQVIKMVKAALPNADGKLVSELVKEQLD